VPNDSTYRSQASPNREPCALIDHISVELCLRLTASWEGAACVDLAVGEIGHSQVEGDDSAFPAFFEAKQSKICRSFERCPPIRCEMA